MCDDHVLENMLFLKCLVKRVEWLIFNAIAAYDDLDVGVDITAIRDACEAEKITVEMTADLRC